MKNETKSQHLTPDHLLQLKTVTQEVRGEIADVGSHLEYLPNEVRADLLGNGLWWACFYELSMIQHLNLYYHFLGLNTPIQAALAASDDKIKAFLDFCKNYQPDEQALDAPAGAETHEGHRALFVCLLIALLRQLECVEHEGCYLSDLVEKVRKGGPESDEAFFKALHIDRTIVSCPTFGERITRAVLEDDQLFFNNLAKGLKTKWKKTSPKKQDIHRDLRIVLQATYESGQLQGLSMTEADVLFIQELAVYSDEGADPARSLQRFILRFRNNK